LRNVSEISWLVIVCIAVTIWSAIQPADYATWFFELFIGAAGVGLLVWTHARFRFSPVVYLVVGVHYIILACGAKYTYAEMPVFEWLKDALHLSRNHFDRVGHFAQGVTPAIVVRELLQRQTRLDAAWIRNGLAFSAALAFSALYEILEWLWVILFYPTRGPEWLGMQGDPWDAQADMLMALLGAAAGILLLARMQDTQIRKLTANSPD
jgi:putative membrane protein